ncbi:MAG: tRNA lysidine(34) synthetase TilS [Clostridia bacterium]|nr:tRNA lysidine(34) synthetase TilS [Clostridia bacterium]
MPPETPVLLALSGGADSVALLHLLEACRRTDGFPLTVAHVHHGIRAEEADRDRDFCAVLAKRYGVELCLLEADVPALARKSGQSLEEAARAVRYEYFARLMREKDIPILVTAHHADDNLETVLFRLARGTGLHGLCGIAPVRPFEDGMLVRPLLPYSKAAILAYCQAQRLEFVTDSTNADPTYARNRLRHTVVPILEELFAGVSERTALMSSVLREDEACLCDLADAFYNANADADGTLPVEKLRALPVAIQKRVLMRFCETNGLPSVEAVHVEALLALVSGETPNARVALPHDRCAYAAWGRLLVSDLPPASHAPYRMAFSMGETVIEGTPFRIFAECARDLIKIHNLSIAPYTILTVGVDIIKKGVFWRSREAGDVILMGGMHRKLRKAYAAAGVCAEWREQIPLLCDEEGVLWAPLVGCRDGIQTESGEYCRIRLSLPEDASFCQK